MAVEITKKGTSDQIEKQMTDWTKLTTEVVITTSETARKRNTKGDFTGDFRQEIKKKETFN